VAIRHRASVKGVRRLRRVHDEPLGQVAAPGDLGQRTPARLIRLIDEGAAARDQTVEEEEPERHLAHERLDAVHPPEAPHQLLERQGTSGGIEGDDLAVQDEGRRRSSLRATIATSGKLGVTSDRRRVQTPTRSPSEWS
jgi:hypothetical protein